ncbi:MAG: transcriptional regulator [Dehalococcoidia bacterium]|nr:MAG: transcriptional regulator [Dehalococcoidia bacterium]
MSPKTAPPAVPASPAFEPLPVVDGLAACCTSLLDCCVSDEAATLAARAFKALSDPARLRLFATIACSDTGEACVCDLVDTIDLTQPTVSHHLKVLVEAGLLQRERRGSWAYFRVRDDAVRDLAAILRA